MSDEFYADTPARDGWEISTLRGKEPPKVEYLWVHKQTPGCWLVSDWDGPIRQFHTAGYSIKPDLEEGRPVWRKIGGKRLAQYFRFERLSAEGLTG